MLDSISTGLKGLDEILEGGVLPGRAYLVRGGPGTGKTTLGFHFLTASHESDGTRLFISLGEPEAQLRENAEALGFDLEEVEFLDLSPTAELFAQDEGYSIFSSAEVAGESNSRRIQEAVERLRPTRVFIDSMTQFRYLAGDTTTYRMEVLSFLRFMLDKGITVLFSSEASRAAPDDDLRFLADGVLHLQYEGENRTLEVTKFRGSGFQSGKHSFNLTSEGMRVFPKLVPEVHNRKFVIDTISSGVSELDELLNGGIERGTVTIVTGPSGVGKTTLGCHYMMEAASRGERAVLYTFEEGLGTLLHRARCIGLPIDAMIEGGNFSVIKVEPLQFSPDEFAAMVRAEVESAKANVVMIDSVAGYRLSVRGDDLVAHVHALSKYLVNMGATVLLINEIEAVTGDFRATEAGISYLADTIVFLRYLELAGQLKKAIGVIKKRTGNFEKTLREFRITNRGLMVGKPLSHLQGILTGTPEWIDTPEDG